MMRDRTEREKKLGWVGWGQATPLQPSALFPHSPQLSGPKAALQHDETHPSCWPPGGLTWPKCPKESSPWKGGKMG